MTDIKIIVATHKEYWMPSDSMYLPLHVGREGKADLGYNGDNTGDNISLKNPNYCELTGLYWAWKNLKADYIGLVHYRRHFSNSRIFEGKKKKVISQVDLEPKLRKSPILVPVPRQYWIETNYSQYSHAHHAVDLDITREIILERYPSYLYAFDTCMKRTIGHRFNMFIMQYNFLDSYCAWLFDILFELETRLDLSNYSQNDSRVFGFVGERLLDIWLDANGYQYKEIPYVFLENQHWLKKGYAFLSRKIRQESENKLT